MSFRNAALLVLAGLCGPAVAQEQGADVQPNRVDYEIEARLEEDTKILDASEIIRWTNNSGSPTSELHFHLYLNAFSNNRTTYATEGKPSHKEGEWGWQQVTALTVDGTDVFPSFTTVDPDLDPTEQWVDGEAYEVEEDRSVFKVTLATPVVSGQTIEIKLDWTSQLPRVRRRTGYKDDFLLVAQWFPKLGVFEGERGWNCHQFHSSTEFFSDYGTYRVTLDLPGIYSGKVGGSGVEVVNREKDGDRVEVVYEAPSMEDRTRPDMFGKLPVVHDFTWTGDPKYIRETFPFKYDEWATKSEAHSSEVARVQSVFGEETSLRDVDVTVLIHPEREDQAQRHFEATANALFFYGLWFGEYPYEHITVVDPVWGDNRAGGMEYPTLFTCGTELFTTPDMYRPESVTVHEAGHQFWYGLVGNNEQEAAWLDEGFNSFTDSEVLIRAYGPKRSTTKYSRYPLHGVHPARLPDGGNLGAGLNARRWNWSVKPLADIPFIGDFAKGSVKPLRDSGMVNWWRDQPLLTLVSRWEDPRWGDRTSYLVAPDSDPIDRPAWTYMDRTSYRVNSYPRPAVALRSLIGVVGYEKFLKGMRKFAENWRYRHPYPQDFFDTFNETVGEDLSWYFEDAFRSTKTIDWSVDVSQSKAPNKEGYFQGETGEFVLAEKPASKEEIAEDAEAEAPVENPWSVTITLRRTGELCLPMPWRVTFEDGTTKEGVWKREAQLKQSWKKFQSESGKKIISVVLDPDRAYYFDRNMSDNQWYADGDEVAPLRWTERVLNQYGHLMHWYAGIGG